MNRQETLDQLVSWLREIATDFSLEETQFGLASPLLLARIYTDNNCYTVFCRLNKNDEPFYLGCTAKSRKERPGEDWTRGNDLPDGPFDEGTWKSIVNAILKYETQNLQAKPPMDLSREILAKESNEELRDDDGLFMSMYDGVHDISSPSQEIVYDTILEKPGLSSRQIFKQMLMPQASHMKTVPVITQARFKKLVEEGISKGHIRARGHRKYELYPVQEWLVSMPFAGENWEKSCSIYADEWIHHGKRGPFKIFHFDTGRRSGKGLMIKEMILRQIERMPEAEIGNILYVAPDRRLRDDFKEMLRKELHGCGFEVEARGDFLQIGNIHVHLAAATDREWYVGKRLENLALVCIDDAEFDPKGLVIAASPPPTRIVSMGDRMSEEFAYLLDRPDAISLKFPAPSVNQSLLPKM